MIQSQHHLTLTTINGHPVVKQEFRRQIRTVRPFYRITGQPVLNKLVFIQQLTEYLTHEERPQINPLSTAVIESDKQFIILDIINIYHPQHKHLSISSVFHKDSDNIMNLSLFPQKHYKYSKNVMFLFGSL